MNICYSHYELEPIQPLRVIASLSKREGALLKVTFDSGMTGYADCHAWPELGDFPVKEQLALLAQGKKTALISCALEFAALDAKSRWEGKSIFEGKGICRSHFLVTNVMDLSPGLIQQIIQQGYSHVKLKVGCNIDRETKILHSLFLDTPLKLRLDFNEKLTFESFRFFLQWMHKMQGHLDFIEDPFPFHLQEWTAIQNDGWTLACDRQAHLACDHPEAARILIVKPALQSFAEWGKWRDQIYRDQICIITSYLGHPLGQAAAAYVASQIDSSSSLVHGLLSHHVYQHTLFSRHLNGETPFFTPPSGSGFGFDEELEELDWIPI